MYRPPKITIPNARPGTPDDPVTGVFEFPNDAAYEYVVETDALYDSTGAVAKLSQVVLSYFEDGDVEPGESLRQRLSFDAGMGRHVFTVDFRAITNSGERWGNTGDGGTRGDATGEDVHAKAAVFDRYLATTTLDSFNPALLEIGEYSEEGRFGPVPVVPRNPNQRFASGESSSTIDGSVDWIETQDVTSTSSSQTARGGN